MIGEKANFVSRMLLVLVAVAGSIVFVLPFFVTAFRGPKYSFIVYFPLFIAIEVVLWGLALVLYYTNWYR
jgi:hypothetical protein